MYTRQAQKNEETWLLDSLEKNDLDDSEFRSREFIFVFDEGITNKPVSYGRIRTHREMDEPLEETDEDESKYIQYKWYEITSVYYSPAVTRSDASDQLLEAIIEKLQDELDGDSVYLFDQETSFYTQYGFEKVDTENLSEEQIDRLEQKQASVKKQVVPLRLDLTDFQIPDSISPDEVETEKEEQGFDDNHTYKYST